MLRRLLHTPRFFVWAAIGSFAAIAALDAHAQANAQIQSAVSPRITEAVNESSLVTLKGNTHPSANAKNDRGPVSPSLLMPDLTLVLSRSPEQQAAIEAFVASQYDQASPNFHQWLTPAEIGARFGPAQVDIQTIANWLTGQGFSITKIAPDGMSIRFSGTAGQVQTAFHTQIHNLSLNGVPHIGNMSDPQIPAALAPVVVGVKALHNFLPRPLHKMGSKVEFNQQLGKWQRIVTSTPAAQNNAVAASSPHPLFGINVPASSSGGPYLEEDVAPYDFATIYNVLPLWNAAITGSGQTIAIAGTSEIDLNDVTTFRSAFGLPAGPTPQQIDTNGLATNCGTTPTASCSSSDLEENSIDVEWTGAVATEAQVVLVVTGQNAAGTVDTAYDSAEYAVENITAKILSMSYGECELGQGTAGNVAYYNLWQSAAAEGISVFVAAGDAGSPGCDSYNGYPYSARYGLAVNGIASTPYDTAVGGTDFSWCKPTLNSSGTLVGCPTSSGLASPYWNSTNNTTTGASAVNYVPEIPWNNTCMNPILAGYLESIGPLVISATNAPAPTNAEGACNFAQNDWSPVYAKYGVMLASFVDTVGGGGGVSGCVANDGQDVSSCAGATTNTGVAYGSIPLYQDGWPKPAWQTGVTGIPADGVRDLPDVSFFAGSGALDSAYLFCVSSLGSCTYSDTSGNTAEEAGGTSFGSPAMAGVMALINQKAGAAQGNPNSQMYQLAGKQTYSKCSAESGNTSNSCYFNDVDQGTNAMPCDLGASFGGVFDDDGTWVATGSNPGVISPDCTAFNTGDTVGTLTNSSGATAYNAATGFDLASGLGSLNVANVVTAWASDAGTAPATMSVTLSATSIAASTPLTLTVTVAGSGSLPTPTGAVAVSGGGYSTGQTLSEGAATITIPGNSLNIGTDTLTVTYSGDANYASIAQTKSIIVSLITPTVTVSAPTPANINNFLPISVTVSGPAGTATPSGTVSLVGGPDQIALSNSGTAVISIPGIILNAGSNTLTVSYSGNSIYAGATGSFTVFMVNRPLVTPTVTITPASQTVNTGQSLGVTLTVSGTAGTPTGTATLGGGGYNAPATALSGGSASFTIPANSFTATGTATLTAYYSGDFNYAPGATSATVAVAKSSYSVFATTPASVRAGGTATSTVTLTSSTNYTGTITLTCTTDSGPINALENFFPTCPARTTVTMTNGIANGTATLTITTTGNAAMLHSLPGGKGWIGGGAVLALLAFLGIPARRRSWRSMLGVLVILAALGSLSACGGGSGNNGTTETASGAYTITVNAYGNDPANITASTTFILTVN